MFNIKIADVSVGIDNKYKFIKHMCRDYITLDRAKFTVSVTDEEIEREQTGEEKFPPEYLEALAIYRKIAGRLSEYDGFLMHGVLLSVAGRGILLCAASGTGKTTHALLWKELLGDKCEIINGDKPIVRIKDGVPYAYGTPWCGKENIHKNASVRITDICFVHRAEENSVEDMMRREILPSLLPSIHIPDSGVAKVLDAIDAFARNVSFKRLYCNQDITAAKVAYNAIFGE